MKIHRTVWKYWKKFAHRIGIINTHVLLFLFYFLIFGPFALVLKLFRSDLLAGSLPDSTTGSLWKNRDAEVVDPAQYKNQF